MNELSELRKTITEIDGKMAVLFEERMEAARKVAAYKKEKGLPVRDRKTEAEKIARQKGLIRDDELRSYYVLFLQSLMDISSSFQERELHGMRVAYSGVEGAYASIAAGRLFPQAEMEPQPLMSARSYMTKLVQPFVDKLKQLLLKMLVRYMSLNGEYNMLSRKYKYAMNDKASYSRRIDVLTRENDRLKKENRDYRLLRAVFGDAQIDRAVAQARAAQETQQSNNRKEIKHVR